MAIVLVPLSVALIILAMLGKLPWNQVLPYCIAINILAFIALSKRRQKAN